jgi:hypothetical protein
MRGGRCVRCGLKGAPRDSRQRGWIREMMGSASARGWWSRSGRRACARAFEGEMLRFEFFVDAHFLSLVARSHSTPHAHLPASHCQPSSVPAFLSWERSASAANAAAANGRRRGAPGLGCRGPCETWPENVAPAPLARAPGLTAPRPAPFLHRVPPPQAQENMPLHIKTLESMGIKSTVRLPFRASPFRESARPHPPPLSAPLPAPQVIKVLQDNGYCTVESVRARSSRPRPGRRARGPRAAAALLRARAFRFARLPIRHRPFLSRCARAPASPLFSLPARAGRLHAAQGPRGPQGHVGADRHEAPRGLRQARRPRLHLGASP